MIPIKEMIVPKGTKRRKGTKLKANKGVTIHEAGTPNAPAVNLAKVQYNQPNSVVNGWHFSVDDKEAWQSFPLDEVAEHSGKREGNDTTVAIEIADKTTTGEYWKKAVDNGAWLASWILKQKGFTKAVHKQNIWQHNDWSGKDCPYQIRRGNPVNWAQFITKVNEYMGVQPQPTPPTPTPTPEPTLIATVNVGELNLRAEPNTNSKILKVLKKGDKVGLERYVNGDQWAMVNVKGLVGYVWLEYITPEGTKDPLEWKVNVDTLNFRDKPDTKSKIIKVLKRGDTVKLDSYTKENDWARVYSGNALGYVWKDYISEK